MELNRALEHIAEIHAHVARGEVFRGYRALPMALTSVLAIVGAVSQSFCWPAIDSREFVGHWLAIAALCALICGGDLWLQGRFDARGALRRRSITVLGQYLPALVVGAALAFFWIDTEQASLLPALWCCLHGLGVFASRPYLPRAVGWVSLWFLGCGIALLMLHSEAAARVPSAWSMGVSFGIGQALLAAVLHRDRERAPLAALDGVRRAR